MSQRINLLDFLEANVDQLKKEAKKVKIDPKEHKLWEKLGKETYYSGLLDNHSETEQ